MPCSIGSFGASHGFFRVSRRVASVRCRLPAIRQRYRTPFLFHLFFSGLKHGSNALRHRLVWGVPWFSPCQSAGGFGSLPTTGGPSKVPDTFSFLQTTTSLAIDVSLRDFPYSLNAWAGMRVGSVVPHVSLACALGSPLPVNRDRNSGWRI
jgi:hypothetical protein